MLMGMFSSANRFYPSSIFLRSILAACLAKSRAFWYDLSGDLSCDGMQLQLSGASDTAISWEEVRRNLTVLTTLYVTGDQGMPAMRNEITTSLSYTYLNVERTFSTGTGDGDRCLVGILCLKLLYYSLWPALERGDDFYVEVNKDDGDWIHPTIIVLSETADWQSFLTSGWPIFRLLSMAQAAWLRPEAEYVIPTNPMNQMLDTMPSIEKRYLDKVDENLRARTPVPIADSTLMLSLEDGSPIVRAIAMLAIAESTRPPCASLQISEGMPQVARAAVDCLKDFLKNCRARPFVVMSWKFRLFKLLDRLSCGSSVTLHLPTIAVNSFPILNVLPLREKVSDTVRICKNPYCDLSFMELALRLAPPPRVLQLVEIGSNLGDCTIWAAAHFGSRLERSIAVEPLPQLAEAFRKSVEENGFADRVQVVQAAASDYVGKGFMYNLGSSYGNPFAHASPVSHFGNGDAPRVDVEMTTLGRIIKPLSTSRQGRINARRLLKVWAFGDVARVLRAAPESSWRDVSAVWLAFVADHMVAPMGVFMRLAALFVKHGFVLAAPDADSWWCATPLHVGYADLLRKVRHLSKKEGVSTHVLVLVAFRPGHLECGGRLRQPPRFAWQTKGLTKFAQEKTIVSKLHNCDLPECCFGLTARQRVARNAGANYDTYFLGDEINLRRRDVV